ncbi:MAG: 2-hydroxyglutaryl-CoA dehydratase [Candidatus Portnoybacteria bacterium RIFCSPLOWO2_01_FULL_43_11]|uniref:2-hydroxyglutaryl-CoA dehydratase n=3 Tax=Candidatus Portnoyibacteriota TaxID=1817913 RepID=A0A1G2FCI6_9BACT|nr:MAG: 2-hydroxyglutaryl-CoA dehydratase [Candidatus Portnoybacteria bacterium RIFCSPHIGHO2_01_FULL_40_12b]OGZ38972.1 MAG: 2-hydroxyglutaryl-CoA dehydratase [Candidatus Portnoybacteria bacterium RIFCSPLOWO2_01_FULL_43_11]OGZ40497.1 MAG: 2-hydroxyglutaryl-CoA dehydratase [Candidatus Portnoybacteria bacterium RIFCSPLOWO2_02_FULL_40_15]
MKTYLGIDIGSISTNLVLIDEKNQVLDHLYLRTDGNPIKAVQNGLKKLKEKILGDIKIAGVGTTGSGRQLIGAIVGADIVKNEITAHAKGALHFIPEARTIIEIGGQDSKIIILRDGIVVDFAMNAICAAGCGAFLDAQAFRLKIPVEEFGPIAVESEKPTNISGRCTVFAESDMIHKQQVGHSIKDVVAGLCQSLVRNYLNNVAKGKDIQPPVVFQGGVSENTGIKKAFEKSLGKEIIVPQYNTVMGAFGMALLAKQNSKDESQFKGFEISEQEINCSSFECRACPNYCEIIEARIDGKVASRWGDRCGKWS